MALGESVIAVLGPYVGETVADTCVRATALSMGKTSDTLEDSDLPAVATNIRRLLAPVTSSAVIDSMIQELERSCSC